jgi:hypothetical protein
MGHLSPEFLHDVFVSYSHGDVDGSGGSPLKTWSIAFVRELQDELKIIPQLRSPSVFLDQSPRPEQGLDAGNPLTAQLQGAASRAALLLLLMSPHYLRSKWCQDERKWWLEGTLADAFPELDSRILISRVWPTRDDEWPKELCDARGHPPLGVLFHDPAKNEVTSRPFGWPNPHAAGGEFRDALVELAGLIALRLKQLNEALERRRQAAADAAKLVADGGQAIYVHARARDKSIWEDACQELIDAGYGVFPDAPEAEGHGATPSLESEIVRTISACDGILLVPGNDSRSLASDLAVIGHQRRNSARAITRKLLPCAVADRGFIGDGKVFLQRSAKNLRVDWIDAAASGWTSEVKTWMNAAGVARGASP